MLIRRITTDTSMLFDIVAIVIGTLSFTLEEWKGERRLAAK